MTSLAPDVRTRWRSVRVPVLAGAGLLVVSVGLALLAGRGATGRLDPDSYEPAGSHALAQLLRNSDVEVTVARRVADARAASPGATVLVTDPQFLPPDQLARATDQATALVLIQPDSDSLEGVGADLVPVRSDDPHERAPSCSLPAAANAGTARVGGVEYSTLGAALGTQTDTGAGQVTYCYPRPGSGGAISASLVREGRVTVLGTGDALTNSHLDESGNAALGLGLLGERPHLVWFRPSLDDPALAAGGSKPLHALLPHAIKVGLLQLIVAVLVIAAWRGRRLGPVVGEPLPVVVRAAESTEGLARLYRRAGARARAAVALRDAAVRSLAPRFGLPAVGADPRTVVQAVARHTHRPPDEIGELLYGGAPGDDAALVTLADSLDTLAAQLREGRTRD